MSICTDCLITQTEDSGSIPISQTYAWPIKLEAGETSFTFKVRAKNDVHVALSPINADNSQMYEIGKIETKFHRFPQFVALNSLNL